MQVFSEPLWENQGRISYLENDGEMVTVFSLQPTLRLHHFSLGTEINLYSPDDKKPSESPYFLIRFLEYDDDTTGLRYGILNRITLGYGLIVNNYTTELRGSALFNPKQAGVKFYTKMFAPFHYLLLGTNSQVYAGRMEYLNPDLNFLGRPLSFGTSYAIDLDGVETKNKTIGEDQAAVALDAGWLLFAEAGTFFVEVGHLCNYSKGFMTGFKGKLFIFDYQVDYRRLGQNFVPGYFNAQYETTPVDLDTLNKGIINGYHAGLGFGLFENLYFAADYEDYNFEESSKNDQSVKAYLDIHDFFAINGKICYEQLQLKNLEDANLTFQGLVPLSILGINAPGRANILYKRVYDAQGDYVDSTAVSYEVSF
jgi:hypothetical protein